jgi:ankyrin repeat protein
MLFKQNTDSKFLTQEQLASMLRFAARNGWEIMAVHLLSLGAPTSGAIYHRGRQWDYDDPSSVMLPKEKTPTPLDTACSKGQDTMAKLLLQHGAAISDISLRMAAKRGRSAILKMLFDHGAVIGPLAPDLLLSAVKLEHTNLLRLLVEHGANVKADGHLALEHAKDAGLESMVEILLDYGLAVDANLD